MNRNVKYLIKKHLIQLCASDNNPSSIKSNKVNLAFFSNSYFTFIKYLLESGIVKKTGKKYEFDRAAADKINRVFLFSPSPKGGILVNYCVNYPGLAKTILKNDDKYLYVPVGKPYKNITRYFF